MTSPHHENQREKHGPLFTALPIEGAVQILYAGAVFATIELEPRLPAGFVDRFIKHAMDSLSGRRSALWDEQAIYRNQPFDLADARRRGAEQAEIDAEAREVKP